MGGERWEVRGGILVFSLLTSHFALLTSRIGYVPFVPVVLFITFYTIAYSVLLESFMFGR